MPPRLSGVRSAGSTCNHNTLRTESAQPVHNIYQATRHCPGGVAQDADHPVSCAHAPTGDYATSRFQANTKQAKGDTTPVAANKPQQNCVRQLPAVSVSHLCPVEDHLDQVRTHKHVGVAPGHLTVVTHRSGKGVQRHTHCRQTTPATSGQRRWNKCQHSVGPAGASRKQDGQQSHIACTQHTS